MCDEPRLAEADRAMASAYRRAAQGGVSLGLLRRQHNRWVRAREAAVRYGPEAVSEVYAARIVELLELGDEVDADEDGFKSW